MSCKRYNSQLKSGEHRQSRTEMILIEEIYNTWRAKACHYQRHSNKSIGYLRWESEDDIITYPTSQEVSAR